MKLYDYVASCNCYKARLLLAQLELPYERVPIDIFDGHTLTDEFARINPARTTPVLETDDGRYLPESDAILVYLATGTPFLPEDAFELGQVARWLIYEQTYVMPLIGGLRFRLLVGRLEESDPRVARRRAAAGEALRLLDDHLATREFFVGERYTIADIAIYGYTHRAEEAGIKLTPYANVRSWCERVEEQPRYIEDVEPYPANAAPGAGRSIYD
ncbi:MAG TPA: glutathione S-transferase family protein [Thermoleophilaceae bacterium]|nr:glutathione S-transferase family protein [Thermoleophilaceae bacterium]